MDIRNYVNRCYDVLSMCVEKPLHTEMVATARADFEQAVLKEYTASPFKGFKNSSLLKDTKLAKEFQNLLPHLPFEMTPEMGEGTALIQMEKSMLDGAKCQMGFMIMDSYKTFAEDRHAGDELFLIINGTADWMHDSNTNYETISAGNIVYNAPMELHGTKANHTPMLAFYIVTH